MNPQYFLGVDIGTTSTKAIVVAPNGTIQSIASRSYPLLSPKPGWAEQDPEVIFQAVIGALQTAIANAEATPANIVAIGFSGAMHSLIAMDEHHQPLTQAIIWADTRSTVQVEQLKQSGEESTLYQRTGTPIHPMSPLAKLIWLREQEPEVFHQAQKFISIKEYIFYQLFGQYIVDHSIASATGLFNLNQRNWDKTALAIAGIRPEQLSQLVPTTYSLQGLSSQYAATLGIHQDTPVVIGASDGVLANLGMGIMEPQQVAVTIGTSAAVRCTVPAPLLDPQGRTFCYILTEKYWVIGGASNHGGNVLQWFHDHLSGITTEQAKSTGVDPYELIFRSAEKISAGAEGLLFLPYLMGERAPAWNSDARGVFFGIASHHTQAHFARALLEGVLFNLYEIAQPLQHHIKSDRSIRASGGFARSPIWIQIMADLFGCEVFIPEIYESSAFGAVLLAMYATGTLPDITKTTDFIPIHQYCPNLENFQRYTPLFKIYQRLYQNLIPEFTAIAQYQHQLNNS